MVFSGIERTFQCAGWCGSCHAVFLAIFWRREVVPRQMRLVIVQLHFLYPGGSFSVPLPFANAVAVPDLYSRRCRMHFHI